MKNYYNIKLKDDAGAPFRSLTDFVLLHFSKWKTSIVQIKLEFETETKTWQEIEKCVVLSINFKNCLLYIGIKCFFCIWECLNPLVHTTNLQQMTEVIQNWKVASCL